MPSNSYVKVLM